MEHYTEFSGAVSVRRFQLNTITCCDMAVDKYELPVDKLWITNHLPVDNYDLHNRLHTWLLEGLYIGWAV